MSYAYTQVDLGPIEQMHALRRMFGSDSPLSHEALAAVSQLSQARRVAPGTELAGPDRPFMHVYLVIDGMLELSREGRRLGVFGNGSGVGVISALAQEQLGFRCVSLAASTLLVLRVEDLFEVLEDYFEMMHGALRNMAADAIEMRRKLLPDAGFKLSQPPPAGSCVERGIDSDKPLHLVRRILHLRQTIGLEHSYVDELAELARAADELRYPSGSRLWSSGDAAAHLLIVVKGEIQATTPDGSSFRFGPGDIVGNLDTIAGVPRWFDAVVTQDLTALSLDSEAIVDVWEDNPGIGFAFLRMLSSLLLSLRLQAARLQPAAAAAPAH